MSGWLPAFQTVRVVFEGLIWPFSPTTNRIETFVYQQLHEAFIRELRTMYERTYGTMEPGYPGVISVVAQLALENIATSDAAIGPKMSFILRVYYMSEAENAEDIEHDRQMVQAGVMSEREFWKRSSTRDVARNIRKRDDTGRWPRDARKKADGSVIVKATRKANVCFH
jgi:hypothetical protein